MSTNEEASRCKLDAIKLGYWKDPFLARFVHTSMSHEKKIADLRVAVASLAHLKHLLDDEFINVTIINHVQKQLCDEKRRISIKGNKL